MKAKYYPDTNFAIHTPCTAKENKDKDSTFDLTDTFGTVFCTSCPASDQPKLGHVVLEKAPAKKDEGGKK